MSWADGYTIHLPKFYRVSKGDRYVIEFDTFDATDPQVTFRPATNDDIQARVLVAQEDGLISQVRIEAR